MIHENTRYLNEPWKIFRELSSLSSVQSSELAKIMAVSGECYWRHFHFIDEHASGLLEENKQTLSMNKLMSYVGTESVGVSLLQCTDCFCGIQFLICSQSAAPAISFCLC